MEQQSSAAEARKRAASGWELVRRFYVALSCSREASQELYTESIRCFALWLREYGRDAVFDVRGSALYLCGMRAGLESQSFVAVETILAMLQASEVGGVIFEPNATLAELSSAVRQLAAEDVCVSEIRRQLSENGAERVRVLDRDDHAGGMFGLGRPGSDAAEASDLSSVYVAKLLLDQVGDAGLGNPRLAKRIVKSVADAVLVRPDLIALLAEMQTEDPSLVRHGATVAVHSILIGRRIGLPSELLVELGVAALFHDVGRLSGGTEGHEDRGFLRFFEVDVDSMSMRAMLVARWHHEPVDDNALDGLFTPDTELMAAIVAVADVHDRAMESGLEARADAAIEEAAHGGRVAGRLAAAHREVLELVRAGARPAEMAG